MFTPTASCSRDQMNEIKLHKRVDAQILLDVKQYLLFRCARENDLN